MVWRWPRLLQKPDTPGAGRTGSDRGPSEADIGARLERLERQSALAETYFLSAFWTTLDTAYEAILPQRTLRCIVCDAAGPRDTFDVLVSTCIFGGGRLERYRCPDCDCIFGPQKYLDLDERFVDQDYRLLYSRYSESDSTSNEVRTFRSLSPVAGRSYLDWGCGGSWSRTVETLRNESWDVWGYEPSAGEASDFVVNQRDAISSGFDGIFSNNVIEHFRKPVEQFRDFHAILAEGGRMAHSSPCYEYDYAYTRFHTLFLLGRSPHVLAERTGFRVVDRVQDGEYINVVFAKA